jgi:soluble lytic murein transglycosylase-like protein
MRSKVKISAALFVMAAAILQVPVRAHAATQQDMREVLKIARGIAAVQPFIPSGKYVAYGIAVHKASKRFDIHPALLISIAQQESGFRADLPEGPAGEIGICQILKSWLSHPELKKEFGQLTIKDLKKPVVSFQIAAWILKDLERRVDNGPLPFWSYYNSPNYKHRLKYYQRVGKKMLALKKGAPEMYTDELMYGTQGRYLASFNRGYQPAANSRATASKGRLVKGPIANSRMPRLALHRQRKIGGTPNPQDALLRTASFGGLDENTAQD